jgi:hypothetical protein
MFLIGAPFVFILGNRFTKKGMNKKGKMGVYITNAGLLVFITGMSLLIGIKAFLMIQLPVICIAGIFGFWLFYVQHQFDPSYWARTGEWESNGSRATSACTTSTTCGRAFPTTTSSSALDATPELQLPNALTLGSSLRAVRFNVWDEKQKALLSFREMTRLLRQRPGMA